MYVYVVLSDRIYDGDTLYGVFDSEEKAKEVVSSIKDPDVRIIKVPINTLKD